MASERAKELAAKQKAEIKAAKEAKKKSDDPNDWGTWRQLQESLKLVKSVDPPSFYMVIAAVVVPIVAGVTYGLISGHWIYGPLIGVLAGFSIAMLVLNNRLKKASYLKYKGQPGSAQVALMLLSGAKRSKWSYTPAISGNRHGDTVHRAVGPGGLILVGDGDPARVKPMLADAVRRHQQLLYDVKVTTFSACEGDGQVPIDQLAKTIEKLPKTLSQSQINEIEGRLKALDAMRQKVPIPRGPMPSTKGARKAIRGR
jgi:hypothetical protein